MRLQRIVCMSIFIAGFLQPRNSVIKSQFPEDGEKSKVKDE